MATRKLTRRRRPAANPATARASLTPEQAEELDLRLVEAGLRPILKRARRLPGPREAVAEDTPEYLATWARAIRKAVPAKELRALVAEFRTLARSPRLSAEERQFARRRARALGER